MRKKHLSVVMQREALGLAPKEHERDRGRER